MNKIGGDTILTKVEPKECECDKWFFSLSYKWELFMSSDSDNTVFSSAYNICIYTATLYLLYNFFIYK